jgi:arylsulfatase A-like enzyme
VRSFTYVTDITPTILDLANVTHPDTYKGKPVHPMMGKSLKPLLEGTAQVIHPADGEISGEMFNNTRCIIE